MMTIWDFGKLSDEALKQPMMMNEQVILFAFVQWTGTTLANAINSLNSIEMYENNVTTNKKSK